MGLHISIRDATGAEHPDWDPGRMAGDREFASLSYGLPKVEGSGGWLEDAFRPVNFLAWRDALPEDRVNPERIPHLLDLVEADPRWWVHFSY